MSDVNHISRDLITANVKEILVGADLNQMTLKMVRSALEKRIPNGETLGSRKKEINAIIIDIINHMNNDLKTNDGSGYGSDNNNNKNNDNNSSNSQTNSNDNKSNNKSAKSGKSGAKYVQNDNNAEKISHIKDLRDNRDGDESRDESSNSEDSDSQLDEDEKLARKLQDEDSTKRVTRNSATRKTRKVKDKKDKKEKRSRKKLGEDGSAKKTGYMKPCALSPALADFLGESEMPRHAVVKYIWNYCREKDLLDPKNKQFAICDNELLKIFGKKRFRLFGMMKHLTKHLQS